MYVLEADDMHMKADIDERMRCIKRLVESGFKEILAYVELGRAIVKCMADREPSCIAKKPEYQRQDSSKHCKETVQMVRHAMPRRSQSIDKTASRDSRFSHTSQQTAIDDLQR